MPMTWIKVIGYEEATSQLKKIYEKIKGPDNKVDNVLSIHSLRPHTLKGHMALYKNVLHNSNNTLPKWYLEAIGVYVSHLNNCDYCVQHHFSGFKRLLDHSEKASNYLDLVRQDKLKEFFDEQYSSGITYAKKLTLELQNINESDVVALKTAGFTDGEILEINQVTAYFNYANRTVVGLGVSLKGDIIGLSPNDSDDPDNWSHS